MRAVVIESFGEPDVLVVREVPDPEPGPDEVLVEVVSSALNRADLLQRRGLYPGPPAEFDIPGMEFAGRVVALGPRVTGRSVGDPVMGIVAGSAHAELLVVHERQTVPVPEALALDAAGAVPEVFITAFDAVVVQGGLTSGRVALVHAGRVGRGHRGDPDRRAVGAEVIVTTSAAGKVAACSDLGATVVVDYGSADFVDAAPRAHGRPRRRRGARRDGWRLPRPERAGAGVSAGCIVQVGVMAAGRPRSTWGCCCPKRATVIGTVLRGRPLEEKIAVTQRFGARAGAAVRRRPARPGDRLPVPPRRGRRRAPADGVQRQRRQDRARGAPRVGAGPQNAEPRGGGGPVGRGVGSAGGWPGATSATPRPAGPVPAAAGAGCTTGARDRAPVTPAPDAVDAQQDDPDEGTEDDAGDVRLPGHDPAGPGREELGDEEQAEHGPRGQVDDLHAGGEHEAEHPTTGLEHQVPRP